MPTEINIKRQFLIPSTLFTSVENYNVTTILGSCIAVCLFDVQLHIGGINHYMLPLWNGDGLATPKFGNIAIDKLINEMKKHGSSKNNLIAKVFGGANLSDSTFRMGERNIQVAYDLLKANRIEIMAEHVGGKKGRKIRFNTITGKVLMKMIK